MSNIKEITVTELKKMIDEQEDFQLIDVREGFEYQIANLEGELIPVGLVPDSIQHISRDKPVVVHCRSGKRSADVIRYLQNTHGYTNLINLKGGILAWSDQIDPTIPKY